MSISLPSLLLGILSLTSMVLAADPPNLIRNGNFQQQDQDQPQSWTVSGEPSKVDQKLSLQHDDAGAFARLACTRCDPGSPASHAMLAQADIALRRGQMYQFSAQVRANGIGGGAISVAIRNTVDWSDCGLSAEFNVNDRWTQVRKLFRATQDTSSGNRLQIWYGEPGTLDVRDVRLTPYSEQMTAFTDIVPAGDSRNVLRNGSFECGASGWSSLGEETGWGNFAFLHGTIERGGAADGERFLRIPLGGPDTPTLSFDYYLPVVHRELSPRAASIGWIAVQPGKSYTLSCQLRASETGVPAIFGIVELNPLDEPRQQNKQVNVTTTWAPYSFTFRPRDRYVYVVIGPRLAEERSVYVDVDAVQLEQADLPSPYVAHAGVELALTPRARGGISTAGSPATVDVCLANASGASRQAVIQLRAKDFFGEMKDLPSRTLSIPARSSATESIAMPSEWRGYYELTADCADPKLHATARLAIVPQQDGGDTVCGINHAFADDGLVKLSAQAGVSWYRDWSLKWQHVEPRQGDWHWEVGDQQIDRVLNNNMRVLPLLPPFPSADWNSEAPGGLPPNGYPGMRLKQAWAPRDPAQLSAFISAAVNRYKDRVQFWEFLNEPLYTDYSLPADAAAKYGGPKYTPADYVKLLAVASKAMKAADPNCRVIGGLAGGPLQERTRELMEAGLLQYIDILNVHMYPGLRAPEGFAREMDGQLALMDRHGGRKPIWITEFSYYGVDNLPRDPFIPGPGSWAEARLLADERQCADYTTRYFLIMLSHGVERIFIHSGASGQVNQPEFECALFDYGGAPRKLYPAMATLTSLLGPSPRSASGGRLGASGWYAAFETGKQSVVALWATSDTAANLPKRPEFKWVSCVGQRLDAPPQNLSSSPVYLVGASGEAARLVSEISPAHWLGQILMPSVSPAPTLD